MRIWMTAVAGALAVLFTLSALGCNTFKGVGRDIEKGGEAIQDTAEDVQH